MVLLVHAASPTIEIGLAESGRIIARDAFPAARDLASTLAEKIRSFLPATGYPLRAVKKIVVHAGPACAAAPAFAKASAGRPAFADASASRPAGKPGGSHTALRIGVTTANTLAYALGVPVIGVTGNVADLEDLLARSPTVEPAPSGVVVPAYSKPPALSGLVSQHGS